MILKNTFSYFLQMDLKKKVSNVIQFLQAVIKNYLNVQFMLELHSSDFFL